ncbi:MAG: ribonuclease HII [Chloroflexi bacterium CFX1]|nr:ribonuclease HII [Chloroflexi bacterium CFX1]MCQ3951728.1 ribonuclease HII [Chloroflexota bacterium]MDL1917919.1 ribonuclease HII [Chloroflexi bacterium CFX5]NUQ59161.1 ribonuclease HII [Anaerolineales bacterium]
MTQDPDLSYEKKLWRAHPLIAGLDEAGRGALAGPVCVGTVILPHRRPHLLRTLSRVRDSKQLTPRERFALAPLIRATALAHGVGFASSEEIDQMGIVPATRLAASRALESLNQFPDYLLTDFRLELPELDIPQTAIVKGDAKCLSVACASILAKTARDEWMTALHEDYPEYQFARHKGYGTLLHQKKIHELGPSPVHRKTFQIKRRRSLLK